MPSIFKSLGSNSNTGGWGQGAEERGYELKNSSLRILTKILFVILKTTFAAIQIIKHRTKRRKG